MHDLNFFQKLYRDNISINDVGYFFTEEINSLNIYNKIFCVSSDEKNFISRFFQNKEIEYIPYSIPEIILPNVKKEIDLLFIGAENPYNLEAILWFLNEVFPNLKDDINLTVCGDVINMYDFSKIIENKNVNLINSVDNLDDLYSKTKIGDSETVLRKAEISEELKEKVAEKIKNIIPEYKRGDKIVLINPNASELLPQRRWDRNKYKDLRKRKDFSKEELKKYVDEIQKANKDFAVPLANISNVPFIYANILYIPFFCHTKIIHYIS